MLMHNENADQMFCSNVLKWTSDTMFQALKKSPLLFVVCFALILHLCVFILEEDVECYKAHRWRERDAGQMEGEREGEMEYRWKRW